MVIVGENLIKGVTNVTPSFFEKFDFLLIFWYNISVEKKRRIIL